MEEIRRKWQRFQKKIKQKGNERLTFMIIPHNEAHIFNLQLSKFTIAFAILIALTIVITSGFSVKLQQNIKQEAAELYSTENAFVTERQHYRMHYRKFNARHRQLRENLTTLMLQAELIKEGDSLFRDDDSLATIAISQLERESEEFLKQLRSRDTAAHEAGTTLSQIRERLLVNDSKGIENFSYGSDVVEFRELHLELKETIGAMRAFKRFIKERESVQKSLPYSWPIGGGHFTSFYGPRISPFGYSRDFHTGIDLADEIGTPVYAAADGIVALSGYNGGYGIAVKLQHRFGYMTLYAHMSSTYVYTGQSIKKGQMIGRVGTTGRSTGPHLHYEVRLYDRHIDPLPFLTSL